MKRITTLFAIAALSLIAALIAGLADDPAPKPEVTRTIDLPKLPPVVVDQDRQDEPDPGVDMQSPEIHEDAVDETPTGVSVDEAAEARITPPGIGPGRAPAGAQNYTLTRAFVQNSSPRAPGTKVSMVCVHFTVSNPGSLAQIRRLFNTPSFGASSHIGIELDGEAELWVPFSLKAWTQGAFNSVCDSIEIVCCAQRELTRAEWLATPLIRRGILAQIVGDRLRARGLPPRLVDPIGCTPKAGVTDHDRLECGNNHWDVGRNFVWDVFMAQVRQRVAGASVSARRARSHRIVHAKLRKRCTSRTAAQGRGCRALRERNRALHKAGV